MLLIMQRKRWAKKLYDTFWVTEKLPIKWLQTSLFLFLSYFPFMFVSLCFFFCYSGAVNMETSKLSLRFNFFRNYFVVEGLCIVTDLVWGEAEILFCYNLFEGLF
ncbi:hypothetical protein F2P56_005986 [Juglans regia]|uniref:Uncharacterized protein n=1 Tax=Juglans regia TaxID=51240 RepID=A0A833XPN4_JUGRE|nr:hypothetical protein F2P56_005986 [Juglans regia]